MVSYGETDLLIWFCCRSSYFLVFVNIMICPTYLHGATTLSKMTFNIMTFSITTLSIVKLSIAISKTWPYAWMTLNLTLLVIMLSVVMHCRNAECHYTECSGAICLQVMIETNTVKNITSVNLRIFVISWSVCNWQTFQACSNKQSSLVRKSVNHGQKSVITLAQRPQL